jgi:predicted TIM-barrel fold metal-dependent hydrolase
VIVDYLCNAFTPDRLAVWDGALSRAGVPVKLRTGDGDGFCEPEEMVARMDEIGVATIVLPACDVAAHGAVDPYDFEHVALRWEEAEDLATRWPGRFAALAVVDPTTGMGGVRDLGARLTDPWVVGMYVHTHSWDRRLDHADYYPYYALGTELDVPVVMQAGASGGLMASECGRPITVDRPALYFPETRFVLSHTGWPWVGEAVAMAFKFPNVFLGTASYPPKRWPAEVADFARGAGRSKVVFGTNFPTVGHRHALAQLDELDLTDEVRHNLLEGTARSIFDRLP